MIRALYLFGVCIGAPDFWKAAYVLVSLFLVSQKDMDSIYVYIHIYVYVYVYIRSQVGPAIYKNPMSALGLALLSIVFTLAHVPGTRHSRKSPFQE